MTNEKKLEKLKAFLDENNIHYQEKVIKKGQFMDLFIGKYLICVKLSDQNDQNFFLQVRRAYHPLFIRDYETPKFVIEKMQNLIVDIMQKKQKVFENQQKKGK